MKQSASSPRFNPWPYALIAFFAGFISLVILFILFCLGQDLQLVRADYYEEEIRYQRQIDRETRTLAFQEEVAVTYHAGEQGVEIRLPAAHARQGVTGRLHWYRPSNAALDHEVALEMGAEGRQWVPVGQLASGLWRVHAFWEVGGQEYYWKQTLVLGPEQGLLK